MIIGLISDTHGLLRNEVVEKLKDCNLIIHAGDVGKNDIIERLQEIAKTEFVYGNIDENIDLNYIDKVISINNINIYVVHNIDDINPKIKKKDIDIIVYGHSHKSKIYIEEDILYINPGSVGPKRFKLEPTMAKVYIDEDIDNYDFEFRGYKIKFIKI